MRHKPVTGPNLPNRKNMLTYLRIQNYALIEELNIQFHAGFSVITGETGAGKSILLGALGLLLGQRADVKAIKNGATRCCIEGSFRPPTSDEVIAFFTSNDLDFDSNECIIRRELTANGKSRAFINDTPVSLNQLKELGAYLIDIHSQHQNLLLNDQGFKLRILDLVAQNKELLNKYQQTFQAFKSTEAALQAEKEKAEQERSEEDYIRFQLQQIEALAPTPEEQDTLEEEGEILRHSETIKQAFYVVDNTINGEGTNLLETIKYCIQHLHQICGIYTKAETLSTRMESLHIELKDIAQEVSNEIAHIDFDPQRQNYIEERLNAIYELEHKHKINTTQELLDIAQVLQQKLDNINDSDEKIQQLIIEKEKLHVTLLNRAKELTKRREKAALQVEKETIKRLIPLGIPNTKFHIEISESSLSQNGADQVRFLFSANKNADLQDITQIASGGEIARIMLSLKAIISRTTEMPTVIFDEIDTGVSGHIAEKMAILMQEIGAENTQVISITHLPQIASKGHHHYLVYKQDDDKGTHSHIKELHEQERTQQIAYMLSGAELTEAAIKNAQELLKNK